MEYIPAKQILSRNRSTAWFGTDYTMNLYRGCCHGCIYCDSRSACYGIEDFGRVRAKENALALLRDELRRKVVVGLPVGPICNPGMDAIEAAIHPADTNYYYFVSDDAGTYYFAATLEEHEANIRKANQVNEQLKSEAAVEETGE